MQKITLIQRQSAYQVLIQHGARLAGIPLYGRHLRVDLHLRLLAGNAGPEVESDALIHLHADCPCLQRGKGGRLYGDSVFSWRQPGEFVVPGDAALHGACPRAGDVFNRD